mmetsp:Transcript_30924/g.68295  ORF Transcript_30924/g.68295 Transcript_30924/m.68295 type:complete len:216 (-) Transcript_30924:86-733(-)
MPFIQTASGFSSHWQVSCSHCISAFRFRGRWKLSMRTYLQVENSSAASGTFAVAPSSSIASVGISSLLAARAPWPALSSDCAVEGWTVSTRLVASLGVSCSPSCTSGISTLESAGKSMLSAFGLGSVSTTSTAIPASGAMAAAALSPATSALPVAASACTKAVRRTHSSGFFPSDEAPRALSSSLSCATSIFCTCSTLNILALRNRCRCGQANSS